MPAPYAVVIPNYNCARYLPRAVVSATAQIPPPAEVLIVDDGSTEPLPMLPAGPVRVIRHDQNRGLPAARNTGLREACSDLVAFLDADDEWRPGKMAAQLDLIANAAHLVAVYTDFAHRKPDGTPTDWPGGVVARHQAWGVPLTPTAGGFCHAADLPHWLLAKTSFCHPSTMLLRRQVLLNLGGFEETFRSAEDLECWVRLAGAGLFGVVDQVCVDVEQRPDSLGHQTVKLGEHLLRLYAAALPRHPALPAELRQEIAARIAQIHADLGYEYRRTRNWPAARRHLLAARQLAPTWHNRLAVLKAAVLGRVRGAGRTPTPPRGNP